MYPQQPNRKLTNRKTPNPSSVGGVLAIMFRQIRDVITSRSGSGSDRGSVYVFRQMINDYINDPRNGIPANKSDQSTQRNNITGQLEKPEMSWRIFCRGLRVLDLIGFEIVIRPITRNGMEYQFSQTVKFTDEEPQDPTKVQEDKDE